MPSLIVCGVLAIAGPISTDRFVLVMAVAALSLLALAALRGSPRLALSIVAALWVGGIIVARTMLN